MTGSLLMYCVRGKIATPTRLTTVPLRKLFSKLASSSKLQKQRKQPLRDASYRRNAIPQFVSHNVDSTSAAHRTNIKTKIRSL